MNIHDRRKRRFTVLQEIDRELYNDGSSAELASTLAERLYTIEMRLDALERPAYERPIRTILEGLRAADV